MRQGCQEMYKVLTLAKTAWLYARPSRRMGNFTSVEPTIFCTLKS